MAVYGDPGLGLQQNNYNPQEPADKGYWESIGVAGGGGGPQMPPLGNSLGYNPALMGPFQGGVKNLGMHQNPSIPNMSTNPTLDPFGGQSPGGGQVGSNTNSAVSFNPSWMQGVTSTSPYDGQVSNYNPFQFASQGTAQQVAGMLGGPLGQANWQGFSPSSPDYQIGTQTGQTVNAGLAAQQIAKYGLPFYQARLAEEAASNAAYRPPSSAGNDPGFVNNGPGAMPTQSYGTGGGIGGGAGAGARPFMQIGGQGPGNSAFGHAQGQGQGQYNPHQPTRPFQTPGQSFTNVFRNPQASTFQQSVGQGMQGGQGGGFQNQFAQLMSMLSGMRGYGNQSGGGRFGLFGQRGQGFQPQYHRSFA